MIVQGTFKSTVALSPSIIEKIEVQLAQLDWDGAVETAQRLVIGQLHVSMYSHRIQLYMGSTCKLPY